jgi:TPR repeat protein
MAEAARQGRAALALFTKAAPSVIAASTFALGALHGGGHGHAQLMLDGYLAKGAPGERNPLEARIWLERALRQGVAEAEADLAQLG